MNNFHFNHLSQENINNSMYIYGLNSYNLPFPLPQNNYFQPFKFLKPLQIVSYHRSDIQTCIDVSTSHPVSPSVNSTPLVKIEEKSNHDALQPVIDRPSAARPKRKTTFPQGYKKKGIRLDFRVKWENSNRNVVPSLISQIISFVTSKNKSGKLVAQIFQKKPHDSSWTQARFYKYISKLKQGNSNYLTENALLKFFHIHQINQVIYSAHEQQFYMVICRIVVVHFLNNEVILISITSSRMSSTKRQMHLIAREALLRKIMELSRDYRN